ncbi:MAG: DUF1295 domain-containing protein [Clostridia bacterium]|nr:DUF1295 domain-containing protein [Clostridia bacterium]
MKRSTSFIIVTIVYVLASILGIITYLLLPFKPWLNLLIADVLATVLTFIFSVIFKNASVYDPYWSVQPIVILLAFATACELTPVKLAFIIVVLIWGVRLTANWAYTFLGLNHQDWRYTMLKEKTGDFYPIINFVGIHLVPTLIVYAVTYPAVEVLLSSKHISALALPFLLLSLLAVILQGTADVQMHRYRNNRETPFIRTGLWKYSRHPNYLGEILMWWGIALASVFGLGGKPYLIIGAILNTLLFIFVSIPLADNRQAKKEGFNEYKKQTHALIPIKK